MCVGVSVWLGWSGIRVAGWSTTCASACNTDTTPTHPHRNSNTHRIKNNTTNVVIQQNSRKFLMMDILMFETCWVHKKWNKTASDIKLVFYSSTVLLRMSVKYVTAAYLGLMCHIYFLFHMQCSTRRFSSPAVHILCSVHIRVTLRPLSSQLDFKPPQRTL